MINNNMYGVFCCPKCKSDKLFEIKTGTDGLFSYAKFSHYKCEVCNHEFKSRSYESVISSDTVKKLVQKGISGSLNLGEMIEEFQKLNIYLNNTKRFKKEVK